MPIRIRFLFRKHSVIGFDNLLLLNYTVPLLSTITQPKYELAYNSTSLLFEQVNQERNVGVHQLLDIELVKQSTTRL